ncbi:MAG: CPBP family intramembrane metalloprotease [Anaerolineales bacterium]|nr:MAG: CPBP family intramembrane metalloprotease [Anaerolineales bacterium]
MNENLKTTRPALASPWIYFLATFIWSGVFGGLAILLDLSMETPTGLVLVLLAALGPMVTGIAFTYLTRDKEGRRDYWRRIIGFNRIPARWYLVILLFVPILNGLAALLDMLIGGTGGTWGETALNALTSPSSIIPSILFATLFPFIEELGWRGYVLDRLQEKHNALISSLILGIVWSVWHLPTFFIRDSYQASLGIGTPAFWLFFAGIIPLTFIFTWIYNNTNRSTLAVILFHAMVNFTGELFTLTERADNLTIGLWFVSALGITVIWGAKALVHEKKILAQTLPER